MLTEREWELLRFVGQFGFMEIGHIERRFNIKRRRAYQLTQKLVQLKLLRHDHVFYHRPGIYRLALRGAKLTGKPSLKKIPLATYRHDIEVLEVYLKFLQHQPLEFISERQLRAEKYSEGVGKTGHLPDGILIKPSGDRIALEVELTPKGRRRLSQLLKAYKADFSFKEVWYYCPQNVGNYVREIAGKTNLIKVFSLNPPKRSPCSKIA